jgi:hypothetical protein
MGKSFATTIGQLLHPGAVVLRAIKKLMGASMRCATTVGLAPDNAWERTTRGNEYRKLPHALPFRFLPLAPQEFTAYGVTSEWTA